MSNTDKNKTYDEIDAIIETLRLEWEDPDNFTYDVDAGGPDKWWKNDPYNWITDKIAVGGDDYLIDPSLVKKMKREGITHVIDCRSEASRDDSWFPHGSRHLHRSAKKQFDYFWNGTEDDGQPKSVNFFRKSIYFALKSLRDNPDAKIYVHCAAGYNRGPSVAYAIMLALGWDAEDAERAICSVRCVGLLYQRDAERAVKKLYQLRRQFGTHRPRVA